MDKQKASKKDKEIDKFNSGWERAAKEAKEQLRLCKTKVSQLRASLKIFEEKIRAGAPYP